MVGGREKVVPEGAAKDVPGDPETTSGPERILNVTCCEERMEKTTCEVAFKFGFAQVNETWGVRSSTMMLSNDAQANSIRPAQTSEITFTISFHGGANSWPNSRV
jgi:hypothetical protein